MRVLTFILSAYLIFLNAVPCCATDNCADEPTRNAQSANHDSGDNNDCGNCSPFFTCTGCTGFTLSVENINIEIIPSFSGIYYTGYILSPVTDVHYDFWQPPRLS